MKKIKLEGLLDDLVGLFDKPDIPSGSSQSWLKKYLGEYTLEQVYEAVLIQLRKTGKSSVVSQNLMPAFFPTSPKNTTLKGDIQKEVAKTFRNKAEDAIVEFCGEDSVDIIKRTEKAYQDQGKDVKDLSPEAFLGTILQNVDSGEYDLLDKLEEIWKDFEAELKEAMKNPVKATARKHVDNKKTPSKSSNRIVDQIASAVSKLDKSITEDEVSEFLSNDMAIGAVASYIQKALRK